MNKNKIKTLLQLFIDYFKVGLFTFGGGLSMIPLIEKTFVDKRKYITNDELLDIVSIAEATPGVIAVNCATYIGYKIQGFIGSLVATIGVTLPSFLVILLISYFYDSFIQIEVIKYLINGLTVGVTFLLFKAGAKIYKSYNKNWLGYVLIVLSFISLLVIKILNINISTILFILSGGLIYLIYFIVISYSAKKKEDKK